MKRKNITSLIAQFQNQFSIKNPFNINIKNSAEYSRKISLNDSDLNQPSKAQEYVKRQMDEYKDLKIYNNFGAIKQKMSTNMNKKIHIQIKLTQLQLKFDYLLLQTIIDELKFMSKQELNKIRYKLLKLQMNLAFRVQNMTEEMHTQQSLQHFLKDLNNIINKSNKIC